MLRFIRRFAAAQTARRALRQSGRMPYLGLRQAAKRLMADIMFAL